MKLKKKGGGGGSTNGEDKKTLREIKRGRKHKIEREERERGGGGN